jgi:hypothetical protein
MSVYRASHSILDERAWFISWIGLEKFKNKIHLKTKGGVLNAPCEIRPKKSAK